MFAEHLDRNSVIIEESSPEYVIAVRRNVDRLDQFDGKIVGEMRPQRPATVRLLKRPTILAVIDICTVGAKKVTSAKCFTRQKTAL